MNKQDTLRDFFMRQGASILKCKQWRKAAALKSNVCIDLPSSDGINEQSTKIQNYFQRNTEQKVFWWKR